MSDSGEKSFIHLILAKLGMIKIGEEERKTVSFGDPSAAAGGLIWSILSVSLVFLCGALRFVWNGLTRYSYRGREKYGDNFGMC